MGVYLRVFAGDPPVGGLRVCRWVVKRIGKKRCDLKVKKSEFFVNQRQNSEKE